MSEYKITDKDSLEEFLVLSNKIGQNLHEIMLVLENSENISKERFDSLVQQAEEAMVIYHRLKACTDSILGVENKDSYKN